MSVGDAADGPPSARTDKGRVVRSLTQEDLKEIGIGPLVIAGYSSMPSRLCALVGSLH
jgi:hypothetical protein